MRFRHVFCSSAVRWSVWSRIIIQMIWNLCFWPYQEMNKKLKCDTAREYNSSKMKEVSKGLWTWNLEVLWLYNVSQNSRIGLECLQGCGIHNLKNPKYCWTCKKTASIFSTETILLETGWHHIFALKCSFFIISLCSCHTYYLLLYKCLWKNNNIETFGPNFLPKVGYLEFCFQLLPADSWITYRWVPCEYSSTVLYTQSTLLFYLMGLYLLLPSPLIIIIHQGTHGCLNYQCIWGCSTMQLCPKTNYLWYYHWFIKELDSITRTKVDHLSYHHIVMGFTVNCFSFAAVG